MRLNPDLPQGLAASAPPSLPRRPVEGLRGARAAVALHRLCCGEEGKAAPSRGSPPHPPAASSPWNAAQAPWDRARPPPRAPVPLVPGPWAPSATLSLFASRENAGAGLGSMPAAFCGSVRSGSLVHGKRAGWRGEHGTLSQLAPRWPGKASVTERGRHGPSSRLPLSLTFGSSRVKTGSDLSREGSLDTSGHSCVSCPFSQDGSGSVGPPPGEQARPSLCSACGAPVPAALSAASGSVLGTDDACRVTGSA